MKLEDLVRFDAADYIRDAEDSRAWLLATLQEDEPADYPRSFQTLARSAGFPDFAAWLGRPEDELRAQFTAPRLDSEVVLSVFAALGWRLAPVAADAREAA